MIHLLGAILILFGLGLRFGVDMAHVQRRSTVFVYRGLCLAVLIAGVTVLFL